MFQNIANDFAVDAAPKSMSLSEILSAFSFALDMTEGQSPGHSLRACWIGTHLAAAIGLSGAALRDVYYAVMLKDLGCSSNAARVSELFLGDDRALKSGFKLIGTAEADFAAFVTTNVGVEADAASRDAAIANLAANAGVILTEFMDTRCTRGADIGRQLRFSEDVATAIAHLDEHWDGSGLPRNLSGDAIHIGGRIALLSQVADVFFSAKGSAAAIAEVQARRGTWLDPALVDAFVAMASVRGFWEPLAPGLIETAIFQLEPASLRVTVDDDYLDDIATAFGQVIDAKSPYTGGHSDRVGRFSDAIASRMGLCASERRVLRRAAMLHDIGKLGVSSTILEKPGKLTDDEWVVMRSHAMLTGEILGRVGVLRDMAMIAASHHERLDGAGYPLALRAEMISLETRIISTADFFDALTADRPYRPAMSVDQAFSVMQPEVGKAIDGACFAALCAEIESIGGIPKAPLPEINLGWQNPQ